MFGQGIPTQAVQEANTTKTIGGSCAGGSEPTPPAPAQRASLHGVDECVTAASLLWG
ncbi:MAG: hypothetical protein ACYC1E_09345 [Propionibacteriaceae bacterium]